MIDLLVYAHEENIVDVLYFILKELRTYTYENKSCDFAPFIQALIKSKLSNVARLKQIYLVYLPSHLTLYHPQVVGDMKHLVGEETQIQEDGSSSF